MAAAVIARLATRQVVAKVIQRHLANRARREALQHMRRGLQSLRIDAEVDDAEVRRNLARLEREVPTVTARAMNKTIQQTRTQAVRAAARALGGRQKDIRQGVIIAKARPQALNAALLARGSATPLKAMKARQTKRGLTYRLWGKRQTIQSAFLVEKLGGHAFKREGKSRLPITKLWGPSVPAVLLTEQINQTLTRDTREKYPVIFTRELRFFLSRLR